MVKISTDLIDNLCFSQQEWDFLLIDLDGLNSFLRSVLPAVSRNFPNLPIIGLSTKTSEDIDPLQVGYGLELDDYLFEPPRPEELIVRFPQVAARYLCDTGSLAPPGTQPFAS
jgi:DNA-binding response OmpR family regulator